MRRQMSALYAAILAAILSIAALSGQALSFERTIEAPYRLGVEWLSRGIYSPVCRTELHLGGFEKVDRTNELLLNNQQEAPNFEESIIGRVQAYTAGCERDFDLVPHLATGLGAQLTVYSTPGTLVSEYGNHPVGVVAFLRVLSFGKGR